MQLQFLGAAETVSGSCFLLSYDSYQVLIDCGMFHGPEEYKQRNYGDFPFIPQEIDAVILTHAHIDHSGLLPKLVKHGYKGPIYGTGATADLCSIMLPDSAYIQESEVERKNRKLRRQGKKLLTPIYTVDDAEQTLTRFRRMIYDEEIKILPGLRLRMRDAGHILGAAIVELWVTSGGRTTKIVFSGDIGNLNQPIVQDPTYISEADIVVVESTYGMRHHEGREQRFQRLAQVVNETMERGGNLLIPAFALGRTQDLLYALRILQDKGEVPPLNVYIDSPLAVSATEIFRKHTPVFDWETRTMLREGRSPFEFDGLHYTQSVEESIALNSIHSGAVIVSASGMADAGRIKHHLKHNLWRKEAAVLLIGYQAIGTLGRRLQDGAREVRIHGEPVQVNASIHTITGFSAHGDQAALLTWLKRFRHIGQIFVVHGEAEDAHQFAQLVHSELNVPTVVPKLDEIFHLTGGRSYSVWEERFHNLHIDEDFSGVVQVWKEGQILFRGSYGFANRRYEVKNTMDTSFNLGSGREIFAAVGLCQLAEKERISWERVRELLEDENRNVGLLEQEIEAITEQAYACYIEEEIFAHAQMERSGYYTLDRLPPEAAVGYTVDDQGQIMENVYAILNQDTGLQAYSTVHDLGRFWEALFTQKLLTQSSLEVLLAQYSQTLPSQRYYEMRGEGPGVSLISGVVPEKQLTITVLSNGEKATKSVYDQLLKITLS